MKSRRIILTVLLVVILVEAWVDIKSEGLAMYLEEAVMVLLIIALFMCLIIYLSMRTASLEKDVSNKSKTGL